MCSLQGAAADVVLVQQGLEMPPLYPSLGHMSAPEGTEGLLFGFPSLHCILLLGFWPLGMPVRGGGCRTGLVWLAAGTAHRLRSWRLRHSLAVPLGICGNGWCSTLQGTAGDSWSIHGRPPWNVLTETGGLANCFSWCVMLYFVIPVTMLLPRYCYSQLWWL